jgi:hypothetical protein
MHEEVTGKQLRKGVDLSNIAMYGYGSIYAGVRMRGLELRVQLLPGNAWDGCIQRCWADVCATRSLKEWKFDQCL